MASCFLLPGKIFGLENTFKNETKPTEATGNREIFIEYLSIQLYSL
jgi:hypothetical protein